ncbi:LPXTG cell wall anchor domain-containing protein [Aquihabitans daechungensis]|uniref:LPXTG cell wall anchor domain-containing protein n=1 Tax=Aquihabitans daechungensis TaxID=1052257 RepID=UPI003BA002B6
MTTTTTTAGPGATTSTTVPPTTASTAATAPPSSAPAGTEQRAEGSLPRTGTDARSLAALGLALLTLGAPMVLRARKSRRSARPAS